MPRSIKPKVCLRLPVIPSSRSPSKSPPLEPLSPVDSFCRGTLTYNLRKKSLLTLRRIYGSWMCSIGGKYCVDLSFFFIPIRDRKLTWRSRTIERTREWRKLVAADQRDINASPAGSLLTPYLVICLMSALWILTTEDFFCFSNENAVTVGY